MVAHEAPAPILSIKFNRLVPKGSHVKTARQQHLVAVIQFHTINPALVLNIEAFNICKAFVIILIKIYYNKYCYRLL